MPALYETEKAVLRKAFALGGGLFYLGVAIGYFVVMPVLLIFFNDYEVSASVVNTFSLHSYISIFTAMVFLMGLLFEFPSVLAVLGHLGVVSEACSGGAGASPSWSSSSSRPSSPRPATPSRSLSSPSRSFSSTSSAS